MALTDIINKITDEANKKASLIKKASDDERKKIDAEAKETASARQAEIAQRGEEKAKGILEKAAILAKMEGRSALLKDKRAVVDSVYEEAEKELNALSDSEYADLLAKMLQSAIKGGTEGHLQVPEKRRSATQKALEKAHLDLKLQETHDFQGGFVLTSGKVEVNATFGHIIHKIVRPQTELEVAKILFD